MLTQGKFRGVSLKAANYEFVRTVGDSSAVFKAPSGTEFHFVAVTPDRGTHYFGDRWYRYAGRA